MDRIKKKQRKEEYEFYVGLGPTFCTKESSIFMKNNFTSSVERASPNLRRNFVMPTRDFDTFSLGKAKNKKNKNQRI